MQTGIFTISLDFEIHWGVSDHYLDEGLRERITNVPKVVRQLIPLFREKEIHVTWATVGMLFCRNKEELFAYVKPEYRPTYVNEKASNYRVAEEVGNNEAEDPFHYANSLIRKIIETPGQEMATHTFSHYYCLEPGQTPEQFFHDLSAAKQLAEREGVNVTSIVFPGNQFHPDYLQQCKKQGIKCYRGNNPSSIYQYRIKSAESLWKKIARVIDTYLPLTGNRYIEAVMEDGILNIPASCFFRPYQTKLSFFEGLRILRMKREMKAAAKKKKIYHLWWHPHNFGQNTAKNFIMLEKILNYYLELKQKYNMRSLSMAEIHDLISSPDR